MRRTVLGLVLMLTLAMRSVLLPYDASFGIKSGISFSNFDFRKDLFNKIHTMNRFTGGLFYGIQFNQSIGARIEFDYSKKGGVYKFEGTGLDGKPTGHEYSFEYSGDYIDLPLLFVYRPWKERNVCPYFLAGPSFAFKLKSSLFGDFIPQLDGGVGIPVGHYRLEARGYYGLKQYPKFSKIRPYGFNLTLGYFL